MHINSIFKLIASLTLQPREPGSDIMPLLYAGSRQITHPLSYLSHQKGADADSENLPAPHTCPGSR